jgi:hypothetical protein
VGILRKITGELNMTKKIVDGRYEIKPLPMLIKLCKIPDDVYDVIEFNSHLPKDRIIDIVDGKYGGQKIHQYQLVGPELKIGEMMVAMTGDGYYMTFIFNGYVCYGDDVFAIDENGIQRSGIARYECPSIDKKITIEPIDGYFRIRHSDGLLLYNISDTAEGIRFIYTTKASRAKKFTTKKMANLVLDSWDELNQSRFNDS